MVSSAPMDPMPEPLYREMSWQSSQIRAFWGLPSRLRRHTGAIDIWRRSARGSGWRVSQQVGGYLSKKVADEECAATKTGYRGGQAKCRIHMQRGEADVYAVEICCVVAEKQQRDQPPFHPRDRLPFQEFN